MSAHFEKEIQLRFREADPAGILFFGNIFGLAHDCFEDFIQATGLTWQQWFQTQDYLIPIRHTECNYLRPFVPGNKYQIRASVAQIGHSSFKMRYRFLEGDKLCAEVLMVHTFLESKNKQKISVPDSIRLRLASYLETQNV